MSIEKIEINENFSEEVITRILNIRHLRAMGKIEEANEKKKILFDIVNEMGEIVLSDRAHKLFEEEKLKEREEVEKRSKEAQKPPYNEEELHKLMEQAREEAIKKNDRTILSEAVQNYLDSHQAPDGKEERN